MKRRKLTRRASKKNFRKGTGTHVKNTNTRPSRGGIRL